MVCDRLSFSIKQGVVMLIDAKGKYGEFLSRSHS